MLLVDLLFELRLKVCVVQIVYLDVRIAPSPLPMTEKIYIGLLVLRYGCTGTVDNIIFKLCLQLQWRMLLLSIVSIILFFNIFKEYHH